VCQAFGTEVQNFNWDRPPETTFAGFSEFEIDFLSEPRTYFLWGKCFWKPRNYWTHDSYIGPGRKINIIFFLDLFSGMFRVYLSPGKLPGREGESSNRCPLAGVYRNNPALSGRSMPGFRPGGFPFRFFNCYNNSHRLGGTQ